MSTPISGVEEEEARAFYDKNPAKFRYLEATIAAEVLLSNEEEAQRVKEQLQAGADAEQLIAKIRHSRGPWGKEGICAPRRLQATSLPPYIRSLPRYGNRPSRRPHQGRGRVFRIQNSRSGSGQAQTF